MKPLAYYNEHDRFKAAVLRHLIEEGEIAPGVVDERSIEAVQPEDLAGFVQCHFFAGVGIWSLCARRAGWPDDRPLWSGSCPCGPFSIAGKQEGFEDRRHLWPEWFRLIRERRPDQLFGEQSDQALAWLDLVQADLEGLGYAVGAPVIPAAGFGGSHERHRIGFVADADNAEWWSERAPWHDGDWPQTGRVKSYGHLGDGGSVRGVGHAADCHGRPGERGPEAGTGPHGLGRWGSSGGGADDARSGVALGDACLAGLPDAELGIVRRAWGREEGRTAQQPGDPLWAGVDWLLCRDSRWRPVEPGLGPLVDAYPNRMAQLRCWGDAIDVETFTNLISAYMEASPS